jgi:hypothetical protein
MKLRFMERYFLLSHNIWQWFVLLHCGFIFSISLHPALAGGILADGLDFSGVVPGYCSGFEADEGDD